MLETARSSKATVGVVRNVFAPYTLPGRFLRYGLASASGGVVDLMAFSLMVWGSLMAWGGIGAGFAAIGGYALGTLWHWQVSGRMVFAYRLAGEGLGCRRHQVLFAASALLGLALTFCVIDVGVHQGMAPGPAKLAAMCVAFASVWLVRLLLIFAQDGA